MDFIADLHIHSRYSRATSREGDLFHLAEAAAQKGIGLLGTGDFTHPAWREEMAEFLVPAEEGLYRLKEPALPGNSPRFVVSGEISCIYKSEGKTRKVHHLILLPSLDAAETLSRRLEAIGNIRSDGRPILGLDSRDLLEITLEACPEAVFIPAHIWTPHFSLFGAFSDFSSPEECFRDLTPHIHAVETGLSSDPPMNWRVSGLDRFVLVSNSDAHSPAKLGREANLLTCELSYPALKRALECGEGFAGTLEFFPEEGKYHLDGHRNCHLRLTPAQTRQYGGRCPVCGKKLTVGVLHRVEELADCPEGFRPEHTRPFEHLMPLPEVIASSLGLSAGSAKVQSLYLALLRKLGSEFDILRKVPLDQVRTLGGSLLAEGLSRLREGKVEALGGFDGEYGVISLFSEAERRDLKGQLCFLPDPEPDPLSFLGKKEADSAPDDGALSFPDPAVLGGPASEAAAALGTSEHQTGGEEAGSAAGRQDRKETGSSENTNRADFGLPGFDPEPENAGQTKGREEAPPGKLSASNPEQEEAVCTRSRVTAVIAGPGTGKTRTLVERAARLIESGVSPAEITAVTFTRQAAQEMKERLGRRLNGSPARLTAGTFHAICLDLLTREGHPPSLLDRAEATEVAQRVLAEAGSDLPAGKFLQAVSARKNGIPVKLPDELFEAYNGRLKASGLLDFDDLLAEGIKAAPGPSFRHMLVDEFQDINDLQLDLLFHWAERAESLFVIGDPDQSVYGFRGADPACFDKLRAAFPDLKVIRLRRNYRSTPQILTCARRALGGSPLQPVRPEGPEVRLIRAKTPFEEGVFVAKEINRMTGGLDMLDAQRTQDRPIRSFSDIAVLCRTHRQLELLEKCLLHESVPCLVLGRESYLEDPLVRGTLGFFRTLCPDREALSLQNCLKEIYGCPADLAQTVLSPLNPFQTAGAAPGPAASSNPDGPFPAADSRDLSDRSERPCEASALGKVFSAPDGPLAAADGAFEPPVESSLLSSRSGSRPAVGIAGLLASALSAPDPAGALEKLADLPEFEARPPLPAFLRDLAAFAPRVGKEKPRKLLESFLKEHGLSSEPLTRLLQASVFADRMADFLREILLGEEADLKRSRKKSYPSGAVRLMTLHGAKGLEFPAVFLCGMSEGSLPLESAGRPADLAEEKRLFYVGLTRAGEELILTAPGEDSPFLADLTDCLRCERAPSRRPIEGIQLSLF